MFAKKIDMSRLLDYQVVVVELDSNDYTTKTMAYDSIKQLCIDYQYNYPRIQTAYKRAKHSMFFCDYERNLLMYVRGKF